jgi:hypothetical protein
MKKILTIALFFLANTAFIYAQGIQIVEPETNKYQIFSEKKGSVVIHLSNHMFTRMNTSSMPVNLTTEVTIFENFTAGPVFTYFRFSNYEIVSQNMTEWKNIDVKYNQYFVGLRANYHLTPAFENLFNKKLGREYFDIYVGTWMGYSFTNSGHKLANADVIKGTQKMRAGALIGVRSMVVPRFGLFMEAGFSSYSFGSFGCTIRLR